MQRQLHITFLAAVFFFGLQVSFVYAGTLTCSVATTCATGVVIFRMSSTSNAHAELPSQSTYAQLVCCSGVTGLGNSCSGTYATTTNLSAATNAHSQQSTQTGYATSSCIQVPSGGSVSVGYQSTDCTGFDTTVASMSAATNAHVGTSTAYITKICATAAGAAAQTLTFSISDNSIGFGALSASAARFATGDTLGSAPPEVEAHTLSASTNAANGYTITVQGATLASGSFTITAIGGTNTASSPGTEQFGLRLAINSGTGTVTAPYAAAGFAYAATAATSSQVASGAGDSATTIFSPRYIANIGGATEAGSYNATLTYVATGNF